MNEEKIVVESKLAFTKFINLSQSLYHNKENFDEEIANFRLNDVISAL